MNDIKVGDKVFIEVTINKKIETVEEIYYEARLLQCKFGGSMEKIIEFNINKWNKIHKLP